MNRSSQFQTIVPFTKMVKRLVIANVAVYLLFQVILEQLFLPQLELSQYFGFVPALVLEKFYMWQFFSYMFLHSLEPTHILFNMLMLWWLGGELEQKWGEKFFLFYYLASGALAAFLYFVLTLILWLTVGKVDSMVVPVVGASGSIFALLLAYGLIFGDRMVYFMFLFPMKAKFFVMILGAVELIMTINSGGGGNKVANSVHVGGILAGFLILWIRAYRNNKRGKPGQKSGPRPNLKLVVDNKAKNGDTGPRYWN